MFEVIDTVASGLCWFFFAYKWTVIIAIFLTWVSADPHHPVVQWINRFSVPLWRWCERWLPHRMRAFSAYLSLLLLIFLQVEIPATLKSLNLLTHSSIGVIDFFTQVGGHTLQGISIVIESLITFAILILAIWFILSIVRPAVNNPVVRIIHVLADPIVTPIQRYMPRTKVDLSPIVGIVLMVLVSRFLVAPIHHYGIIYSLPVSICMF